MKKIQVTAVELKAQSEVIVLNSSFVAKAVRAADAAQKLKQHFDEYCPVILEDSTDLNSKVIGKDWEEWMHRDCNLPQLGSNTVADVFEKLVPFAIELSNALLGEEA